MRRLPRDSFARAGLALGLVLLSAATSFGQARAPSDDQRPWGPEGTIGRGSQPGRAAGWVPAPAPSPPAYYYYYPATRPVAPAPAYYYYPAPAPVAPRRWIYYRSVPAPRPRVAQTPDNYYYTSIWDYYRD